MVGTPTTAHRARYRLWCYLWGRQACSNNIPTADTVTAQEQP